MITLAIAMSRAGTGLELRSRLAAGIPNLILPVLQGSYHITEYKVLVREGNIYIYREREKERAITTKSWSRADNAVLGLRF